ncbi:MAG: HNH endonuclease [Verrucomicrobia bacterium]|nr:HNH endonuclease [Verrucomicrobiota bacterium]
MSDPYVPRGLRSEVSRLARGCCEYCLSQVDFSPAPFSVDHVVSVSNGGATELSNLALACEGCNGHKAAKTAAFDPVTGRRVPLFHPRQQHWADHFAWSDDDTMVIGLTAVGRATVEALRLNRPHLQHLRAALREAGFHPPPSRQEPTP